jgi:hypothetical protein
MNFIQNKSSHTVYLIFFALFWGCDSQQQVNQVPRLTLIPATDYLYVFNDIYTSSSKIDSLEINEENFDSLKLYALLFPQKKQINPLLIVKPASVANGLGNAEKLVNWLNGKGLKYEVQDTMSAGEKERFQVSDLKAIKDFQKAMAELQRPPDPSKDGLALIFYLKEDGTIKYKTTADNYYSEENNIPIYPASTENIFQVINQEELVFKEAQKELKIFVVGNKNAKYAAFKNLTDAFKKKDFYKFKILIAPKK